MKDDKRSVFDGVLGGNIVLSSLMVISPIVVCCDSLKNASALCFAFSAITTAAVTISSFVPKKLPYTLKTILYALVASLVYIPVKAATREIYPDAIERLGIYFPLLAVNSLIVLQAEAKLFKQPRAKALASLIFYVAGFDAVALIIGFLRELFAYGTINGKVADVDVLVSGLSQPFGGFIFLGLACGLYRWIRSAARRRSAEIRRGSDVSD